MKNDENDVKPNDFDFGPEGGYDVNWQEMTLGTVHLLDLFKSSGDTPEAWGADFERAKDELDKYVSTKIKLAENEGHSREASWPGFGNLALIEYPNKSILKFSTYPSSCFRLATQLSTPVLKTWSENVEIEGAVATFDPEIGLKITKDDWIYRVKAENEKSNEWSITFGKILRYE